MTVAEAARILKIDREWLRTLAITGALKRADTGSAGTRLIRFERSYIEGLVTRGWKPPGYH